MKDPMLTPCSKWEERLASHHPEDLSPIEWQELTEHTETCKACAMLLADYRDMDELIRRALLPRRPLAFSADITKRRDPKIEHELSHQAPMLDEAASILHDAQEQWQQEHSMNLSSDKSQRYVLFPRTEDLQANLLETSSNKSAQAKSALVPTVGTSIQDPRPEVIIEEVTPVPEREVGTTIQDPPPEDRYVIEGLLGTGGFGAVYLVRDRRVKDNLFALKEMIDPNRRDRERFLFEGEILKRLNHRALPCVYKVFEHDKRIYMLMDYVQGKNLEALRQEQPEHRFPLPVALALMAPIVDALLYLHQQVPPIVHRDIKPANIIVPEKTGEAMLVDFGLAKEFVEDRTTSVIRHGSPGYAALEQYGKGTTPLTDMYGLGATFYTLLTGTVPIDAVTRATASKGVDPLTPASVVTPDVPTHIAKTLRRAMSISSEDRFSSLEEFWLALTTDFPQIQATSPRIRSFAKEPIVPSSSSSNRVPIRQHNQNVALWKRRGMLLPILFALLLIGIVGTASLSYTQVYGRHTSISQFTPSVQRVTATARPTQKPSIYPIIASSYSGEIGDLMTGSQSNMYLTNVQQNQGNLQGNFQGLDIVGPFKGTVTRDGMLQFTVTIWQGSGTLSFQGTIKVGGDIEGNFKVLDQHGNWAGESGPYYLNFPSN